MVVGFTTNNAISAFHHSKLPVTIIETFAMQIVTKMTFVNGVVVTVTMVNGELQW
jgi:hypothetical protein